MDTLSECHVTSLHYASPSPVQRVDWWRPLWGIHGGRHTHLAPSEHRQHLSLPLHLVVAEWGHLLKVGTPSTSLSSLRKRSTALIAPRVYVSETDNMCEQNSAVGWPIFRSVSTQWLGPQSRIQARSEDAALWHLWSSLRMALRVLVPTHLRKAVHASPWFNLIIL